MGAYDNYQIVKDTSGQIVPQAIANSIANLGKGVAEGRAKREAVIKAAAKKTAAQGIVNNRYNELMQNELFELGKADDSLSSNLQKDIQGFQEKYLTTIFDLKKSNANPDTTPATRKTNNETIIKTRNQLSSINTFVATTIGRQKSAIENIKNGNDSGYQYQYNEIVGDDGDTMQGLDIALSKADNANNSLRLTENEDGEIIMKASGAYRIDNSSENAKWGFDLSLDKWNNPEFSTTSKITQSVAQGTETVIDRLYGKDADGKKNKGLSQNVIGDQPVKVITSDAGSGYTLKRTVQPLNSDEINIQITASTNAEVANFLGIGNRRKQNPILVGQLGLDKEWWDRYNNENTQKKANEELENAFRDSISDGVKSAERIEQDAEGNWIKPLKEITVKSNNTSYNLSANK